MTEINSDDSLFTHIANKSAKSPPCVEGSTRKTRKCTAACVRSNKGDRCTGAANTAAMAAATASLYCSDAVQKTYRPTPQHDRGSACIKNAADCRGQCPRTGKYSANDSPQCTSTRSYKVNESQCTGAAGKCGTNNNRCTGTGNYRTNDSQCTIAAGKYGATDTTRRTGTGNYRANDNIQSTGTGNYRANDGQYTGSGTGNYGANNNRCTGTGNYRADDGQFTGAVEKSVAVADNTRCTGTGNYGINNNGCNGCGCISASAAVVASAACLGGANAFGRSSTDTLMSTVYKWARVSVDWAWDKTYYFLVAIVSFFLGLHTYDWCLCTCEEVS